MGIFPHGSIMLRNITPLEVRNILSGFPTRYHRYYHKSTRRNWKCMLPDPQSYTLKLQLVDLTYDRPRGKNAAFESPSLFISLQQAENDVVLKYKLQWKTSIIFCALIGLLFSLFPLGLGLYSILFLSAGEKSAMLLGISIFMLVGEAVWIYRLHKHDKLILQVFSELLHKNFLL